MCVCVFVFVFFVCVCVLRVCVSHTHVYGEYVCGSVCGSVMFSKSLTSPSLPFYLGRNVAVFVCARVYDCMCVCARERVCVCVCVCARE